MKVALVDPPWSFDGSIYFGCREPHLPLEYGYAKALLEREGHEARIFDAQLRGLTGAALREEIAAFGPDMTAITTAPSYLFWRCAPPELRVPMRTAREIRDVCGKLVVVGPHASTTPRATLLKLEADAAVVGECEDVLTRMAGAADWSTMRSVVTIEDGALRGDATKNAADVKQLPALSWAGETLARHRHHHHRFDRPAEGAGAEVEASRGCPYHCTFCAKDNFRDAFRKRPLETVLEEIDGLIAAGVRYVYFVDEIFVPDRKLLEALAERDVELGVQMRIDNWSPEMLELLGRAGCVSIEAGVESITQKGRSLLAKKCRLSTAELTELLVHAKKFVPFVQANLLESIDDSRQDVATWRALLASHGVWTNDPVPLFPYPGSPEYTRRFGTCDDGAWERAHEHYLTEFARFSDIQDDRPTPLAELERNANA